MKRDYYIGDFVNTLYEKGWIEEFQAWADRAHPTAWSYFTIIEHVIDEYKGGRKTAYNDLKNGIKIWEVTN